jgi:hypothetical protein
VTPAIDPHRDVPTGVRYLFRGCLIAGAVLPLLPPLFGRLPNDLLSASALLLIAAGCLYHRIARGPRSEWTGFGAPVAAGLPGALMLSITLLPGGLMLLFPPLLWVTDVWSGHPAGTGMLPSWMRYPFEVAFESHQSIAIAIAAAAAGVLGYAVLRTRAAVVEGVGLILPAALPFALAANGAIWPAIPVSLLAIGAVLVVAAGIANLGSWRRTIAATQGFAYLASGTAACLPMRETTIIALGLITLIAVYIGWYGRRDVRVPAWIFAVMFAGLTGGAGSVAVGLSRHQAAFAVLAAAVAALVLAAAVRASRRREASAIEATAHVVMIAAVILTLGSLRAAIVLCTLWTVAVGARILWPATSTSDRRFLASYAAVWLTLTWWLLIGPPYPYTEAYTLPLAGVALLGGWAARRRWRIKARNAYTPAVALAVLPTLKFAWDDGDRWRYLILGALIVAGVAVLWLRRRHARVAVGG